MTTDSNRSKITILLTVTFLLPYFLYRSSSPLPTFGLYSIMLPLELFLLYLIFTTEMLVEISTPGSALTRVKYAAGLLLVFLLLFLHSLGMQLYYEDGNILGQLLNLVRLTGYIFATAIFARFYFDFRVFQSILFGLSFWFSLVALSIYYYDPLFFSDSGYGVPRPKFLFSEPSALAPVVTFLFCMSIIKKNLLGVLISMLMVFHLSSGVVVLVLASTLMAWSLTLNKTTLAIIALLILTFFFMVVLPQIEGSYLYSRIASAVVNTDFDKMSGGTARLVTLFNLAGELLQDERVIFGRGFNTAKVYFGQQWEFREFGLIHFYLFSFGILGVVGLFVVVLFVIRRIYKQKNIELLIMAVPFIMASLLNSAQGTVLHKFAYLFIFVVLFRSVKPALRDMEVS